MAERSSKSKGDDMETITPTAVVPPNAFQQFVQKLSMHAEMDANDDGDEASGSTEMTVMRIMTADDDSIWDAGDLVNIGGRNLVDVEQRITGFKVRFSANNTTPDGEEIASKFVDAEGRKLYLLVNSSKLENGEEFVWNTSAPDLVAKIVTFYERDKLPLDCVIRGTDLGGGKTYLRLKPVPKRAVR